MRTLIFLLAIVSISSCGKILDEKGVRSISISYAGGTPDWGGISESKDQGGSKISWRDPVVSGSERLKELRAATPYVEFITSLGPQFETPINFDASAATLPEIIEKLGAATGTVIPYRIDLVTASKASIKARRYYPEAILSKVIEFYKLEASFEAGRLILAKRKS
jgi:hypothetical protein